MTEPVQNRRSNLVTQCTCIGRSNLNVRLNRPSISHPASGYFVDGYISKTAFLSCSYKWGFPSYHPSALVNAGADKSYGLYIDRKRSSGILLLKLFSYYLLINGAYQASRNITHGSFYSVVSNFRFRIENKIWLSMAGEQISAEDGFFAASSSSE